MKIRSATLNDIPWLLGELRQFDRFYGTQKSLFPSDETIAIAELTALIEGHVFFIAEKDGQPVGFIAGVVAMHPDNPDIVILSEKWWWVSPEHRGSSAGFRLFEAFKAKGHELLTSGDWITMALEKLSPVDPRCLESRGFRHLETNYLMEIA